METTRENMSKPFPVGRMARSVQTATFYLLVLIAAPACAHSASTIPVEIHNGHVFVQVTLLRADRPLWFLIDSGAAAPVNLIAKPTADRLGFKGVGEVSAGAIGGKVSLTFTPRLRLKLGSTRLPRAQLAIIPLGNGEQKEGHAVDGILGYAFFKACNPEIDYRRARMRLSASPAPRSDSIEMRMVGKNILIDGAIELAAGRPPVAVRLIVDTGYDGALLLTSSFVRKHDLLKSAGPIEVGAAVGGNTAHRHMVLRALAIGNVQAKNLDILLSTDAQGAFATDDADGYLGGDFLQHYDVLFDYSGGRFALAAKSN